MGSGSSFVQYEYEKENALLEHQAWESSFNVPFSIRLDGLTASIIDGLAVRFGTSRNSIIGDMLKADAMEALQDLKPEDRVKVAEFGDKAYEAFQAKNSGSPTESATLKRLVQVFNGVDQVQEPSK